MLGNYNLQTLPKDVSSYIEQAVEAESMGNNEKAAECFRLAALETVHHEINPRIRVMLWRDSSMCHYNAHKPLECIQGLSVALEFLKKMEDRDEQCLYHIFISDIFLETGDMLSSLEELQLASEILKLIDNEKMSAWVKTSWGNYYRATNDPERAISMYADTLPYFEKENEKVAICGNYLNLGMAYEMKTDYTIAEKYYHSILNMYNKFNISQITAKRLIVKTKSVLGGMYLSSCSRIEEAITTLEDALNDSKEFSLVYEEASISKLLGEAYLIDGNTIKAKELLLRTRELSINTGNIKRSREILLHLANIERQSENYDNAVQFFHEYSELVKQEERDLSKRRPLELEIRLHRIEEKRKNEILEKELQIKQKVNEAVAIHMKENEKFLTKLHKRLIEIEPSVKIKSKKEIVTLKNEIKDILLSKKEWTEFENGFLNAHSELEQKLIYKYPSLTLTERKVCIFLHSGRSTKEIASLLHISPDTVDTHRINIRRKMSLQPRTSIRTVLASL